MFSTTSWILFGVIALVAVVVIWKWWKTPSSNSKKNDDVMQPQMIEEETEPPPPESLTQAPPMVFAVNDQGNLDLTDMSGKILNIGFGAHPKTYVILLDFAEKDTEKIESDTGVQFMSKVGNTKRYEAAGRPYIINYTRLA